MRQVYLVFRLSYVIDSSTILPVLVKEFAHRDEAARHVREHGGFLVAAEVAPTNWSSQGSDHVADATVARLR